MLLELKFNKYYIDKITEAYSSKKRFNNYWLGQGLVLEASELSTLFHKYKGYEKKYSKEELVSELGDVFNFLTAILIKNNISFEEIIKDNLLKLKTRGYIK